MKKIFQILPLTFVLAACSSTFGSAAKDALTYEAAVSQPAKAILGKKMIVGGPVIAYQYSPSQTQIEIASAPLNEESAPAKIANNKDRAIVIINGYIAPEELDNVRFSAIGRITDVAQIERYGKSTVIMITADDYRIWRASKPMFGPSSKPRYGYKYDL